MQYKFVEALGCNGLYLKAMLGRFDNADWERPAIEWENYTLNEYGVKASHSLLESQGHSRERSFIILDLSSGTGGAILPFGGYADFDVQKAPATF